MKLVTLALFALTAPAWAQDAVVCKPDYQVVYKACKATDKVTGYKAATQTVRAGTGMCNPNDNLICEQQGKAKLRLPPDVKLEEARLVKAYHKDNFGKACYEKNILRARVDVHCDYEYQEPVKEVVADPSCPVDGVAENSTCMGGNSTLSLDPESVTKCLEQRPQSEAEYWLKTVCLVDINDVQNAFRLKPELDSETYKRVQSQLLILKTSPNTPASVKAFLAKKK